MVNIWTRRYYSEHQEELSRPMFNTDFVFENVDLQHYKGDLECSALRIMKSIDGVTDVNFDNSSFVSTMNSYWCDKSKLSTGCKTALLALWYSYYTRGLGRVPLCLDEAGPNALRECVEIIDGCDCIVGVLGTPLKINGSWGDFTIRINEEKVFHNWLGVTGTIRAEQSENDEDDYTNGGDI